MKDFRRFIVEAKRRGLRVITELVINHTSDQHDWFKRARRSDPKSSARNWYVWSDTDQKYQGTRIIFTDTEKSNWTWDPEAGQFYWHRFFSHQPDLNFDNPRVVSARGAGDEALARYRRRRLPARRHSLSVRARRHQQREPARDARHHQAAARRTRRLRQGQGAAGRSQSMAGGRAGIFRPRRRMPHGLSFPADAAHLHGDRAGRPLSDHRHPAPDAGYSRTTASGRCSCATTTS